MPVLRRRTSHDRLEDLAEFRYHLRNFLRFSEEAASRCGLQPQQHQLLLQIVGARNGVVATIAYLAQRLGLRHHSVVQLSKRCEEVGLITRTHAEDDRRWVVLQLTAEGQKILDTLSEAHAHELTEFAPLLIKNLIKFSAFAKETQGSKKGKH
jgi:DNA-binding MarR family transcriptional regulator